MAAKQLEALAGRACSHLVRPGIGERGGTVVAHLLSPSLDESVRTPGHGADIQGDSSLFRSASLKTLTQTSLKLCLINDLRDS